MSRPDDRELAKVRAELAALEALTDDETAWAVRYGFDPRPEIRYLHHQLIARTVWTARQRRRRRRLGLAVYGFVTALLAVAAYLIGGTAQHPVSFGGAGNNQRPAAGCSGAANTPDGADLWGGCWPGPNNTGPNASEASMSTYGGSCTITAPNVTIDSQVVNCSPVIVGSAASGLMIKNSYVKGGVVQPSGSASFTIQDSLIDNNLSYAACTSPSSCPAGLYACGDPNNQTTECGVGYQNFTILRTEIMHTNRAAYCESTCTIQDNYFHGTNLWPDHTNLAHASSVRNEQYLTLRHNSLHCDYRGPFYNDNPGCSADVSGYPDFAPIMHSTLDRNLFMENPEGNAYCVYGGGTGGKPFSSDPNNATYIVYTDNVFQKGSSGLCGTYGPVADYIPGRTGNVFTGNVYDDGSSVPPT